MTTPTKEQEVTGPPPSFGEDWTPPEGAVWVPIAPTAAPAATPANSANDVDSPTRSEAPTVRQSHRKHIGAVTAAGGIVGGVALWQAFGVVGLIAAGGAAAGLIAAPVAAYALYKRRGRNRTPMGRRLRGQRLARRATSRLSSTGLSRGRSPKLGGRGGPKLGGKPGRLLGGKSGRLLGGGKGAKLGGGKSGLGTGRSKGGLLGSRGRGGKLLGGGRGSGLGGKSLLGRKGGRGLIGGGRSRGSGVSTANRSGGLSRRASRGGLSLGKRGGKATRGALGRWSKSTGAGAGILGRKAATATRHRAATAAQRAANTRAGQRVAKAVQAAKLAHGGSTAKSPFARWRAAARAAHAQMPRYGRPYSNWATGVGAGVLALLAVLELRRKAGRAKRAARAAGSAKATAGTGTSTGSGPRWTSSTTHEGTYSRPAGGAPFTPPPQPPPTIKVEVIRDEPMRPASLGAAPLAIGPGSIRKESPMKFPLLAAAEEFRIVAAGYVPPDAHELAPDFDDLPEVISNLASGFRSYAIGAEQREPLDQPVIDALHEVHVAFRQAITAAEQVGPTHRKVHSREIEKAQDPRQRRWNI